MEYVLTVLLGWVVIEIIETWLRFNRGDDLEEMFSKRIR